MQGTPTAQSGCAFINQIEGVREETTMEYLKPIFGDKTLTYAELEAALKDSKDVKLGNLASGQYVDKAKLDGKIAYDYELIH